MGAHFSIVFAAAIRGPGAYPRAAKGIAERADRTVSAPPAQPVMGSMQPGNAKAAAGVQLSSSTRSLAMLGAHDVDPAPAVPVLGAMPGRRRRLVEHLRVPGRPVGGYLGRSHLR